MGNDSWFVQFIREQAAAILPPPVVHLAKVTSLQPFRIKMEGEEFGAPFLMVDSDLLAATKTYDATLTTNGSVSGTLTTTQTDPAPLAQGDTVLVFSVSNRYVVTSKVVDV